MSILKLPPLNPAIRTATVTRWIKKPGESVQSGDLLVELEAELAFVQLEANSAGKLQSIKATAGTTVAAGSPLGEFAADRAGQPQPTGAAPAPLRDSAPQAPTGGGDASKVIPVLMPQAGNTMEEGTVLQWNVREGDQITVGQAICEIETDKATMEFEAPDAGRLARIVAGENQIVAVKEPIAYLAENDADVDAYLGTTSSTAPAASPAAGDSIAATATGLGNGAAVSPVSPGVGPSSTPTTDGNRVKASPAARRLAAEQGLDLRSIGVGSVRAVAFCRRTLTERRLRRALRRRRPSVRRPRPRLAQRDVP